MNTLAVMAVFTGAGCGALLRWLLSHRLNPLFSPLPIGTLVANLVGGLLIGIVIAWTHRHPTIPPELRLFVITGFLGGLTTFSTFSIEVVNSLLRGDWWWGGVAVAAHVIGSLMMTAIGVALVSYLLHQ